jgi:hypothetical protein
MGQLRALAASLLRVHWLREPGRDKVSDGYLVNPSAKLLPELFPQL